jgi:hypothetical protein
MEGVEEKALCEHVSRVMVLHHHSNGALSRLGEIYQPSEYLLLNQGEAVEKRNGRQKYSDQEYDSHGHLHLLPNDVASKRKKMGVAFVMMERMKTGRVPPP